jgi:hypothetical protein
VVASPSFLAPSDSGWGYGCTNYPEDIRARIWAPQSSEDAGFVAWLSWPCQSAGRDWWMGGNVPVGPAKCDCTLSDVVGLGAGTRGFRSVRPARPRLALLHSHRWRAPFSASKLPRRPCMMPN